MKILIVGATGGWGRAAVMSALAQGHEVTAFSRRASRLDIASPNFRAVDGDVMTPEDVADAVRERDAPLTKTDGDQLKATIVMEHLVQASDISHTIVKPLPLAVHNLVPSGEHALSGSSVNR